MRNLVIALSLTVALLAGCIIGATASRLVVPPVRAAPGTQKWEHYCYSAEGDDPKEVAAAASKLGALGFEMVDGNGNYYCFKRPRG